MLNDSDALCSSSQQGLQQTRGQGTGPDPLTVSVPGAGCCPSPLGLSGLDLAPQADPAATIGCRLQGTWTGLDAALSLTSVRKCERSCVLLSVLCVCVPVCYWA